jgi:histidinol dehydrogenase
LHKFITIMKLIVNPKAGEINKLIIRPEIDRRELEKTVSDILADIKKAGDVAVRKYSRKFDRYNSASIKVSDKEIAQAAKEINPELKKAISVAYANIRKFHLSQKEKTKVVETSKDVKCWRKSVAIEKVGLYIPGGTAPLFSTILMLGIPAKLAGCKEITMCTPPDKNGQLNSAILYVAKLTGVKTIYKLGGAQAIAAMAYGTKTIKKVYKIFGPGNQYVTCAKQLVNNEGIAIDMPAGPSEVAVLADEISSPVFIAADLLSQAEHGADSQVMLFIVDKNTENAKKIWQSIKAEIKKQLTSLPRRKVAEKALENSKTILFTNYNDAINMINEYAPEHLIIACKNENKLAEKITNAGSVFIGKYTPESCGDYASGTNHTLPTNGYAKSYSGVSLDSFVKKITFQKITKRGLKNIGPYVETMAETEELQAHKYAVTCRITD